MRQPSLHRIASAPMFVTDGAISPDGEQVALRTYTSLYRYPAENFLAGDTNHAVKSGLPRQPQGETVAFTKDSKSVLVGTEGALTPIYNVPLSPLPQPTMHTGAAANHTAPTNQRIGVVDDQVDGMWHRWRCGALSVRGPRRDVAWAANYAKALTT